MSLRSSTPLYVNRPQVLFEQFRSRPVAQDTRLIGAGDLGTWYDVLPTSSDVYIYSITYQQTLGAPPASNFRIRLTMDGNVLLSPNPSTPLGAAVYFHYIEPDADALSDCQAARQLVNLYEGQYAQTARVEYQALNFAGDTHQVSVRYGQL